MRGNRGKLTAVAFAVAVALAAGCSSGNAPAAGTPAGNALVCKHYLTQRNWVKNLTQPTVADAEQFISDITVDKDQASGKLYRDLQAMVKNATIQGRAYYQASTHVYDDCA